jgi:hypothetical protein
MDYVERRSMEELVVLYQLEPEIRDIIVEGSDDAALLNWYLKHRCNCEFTIIEINAIEVHSDAFEQKPILNGNRGRIIALSNYLDKALTDRSRNCVTLVVDDDYDRLMGICSNSELLLRTDFTCLEMYLFDESIFDKLISVVLSGASITATDGLNTLAKVLQRLWVCKATNHILQFSMSWVDYKKYCTINGDFVVFDEQGFVKGYLEANGRKHDDYRTFITKRDELTSKLGKDPRFGIDGHHFLGLSRWYLKGFVKSKNHLSDQKKFDRSYFGCQELSNLDTHYLFQRLLERIVLSNLD